MAMGVREERGPLFRLGRSGGKKNQADNEEDMGHDHDGHVLVYLELKELASFRNWKTVGKWHKDQNHGAPDKVDEAVGHEESQD